MTMEEFENQLPEVKQHILKHWPSHAYWSERINKSRNQVETAKTAREHLGKYLASERWPSIR